LLPDKDGFWELLEAVAAGDADFALDAWLSEGLAENLVRFPAQVHISSTANTWFIVLNTEAPPFDNVEVRRAVNLALDRDRVAQIAEEILGSGVLSPLPTCQTLPPNFPGYEPYCPYTMDPGPEGEGSWTAPDLEGARELVKRSGTAGMRVVFEYDNVDWKPLGPSLGEYMVELLEDLGYRGSVRAVPPRDIYRPGREFQMVVTAWGPLYPAASDFIASLHKCGATFHPIRSGFCDPAIDAMIDRAIEIQLEDPAAAGALWAEADREVVDQAPYLWLFNREDVSFVSERVGNYQHTFQWGVLLNQLWVR
jgi:peptide/nickel transport system substrate-binding protein